MAKKSFAFVLAVCISLTAQFAFAQQGGRGDLRRSTRPIPNQYIVVLASQDDPLSVGLQAATAHSGRLQHVFRNTVHGFSMRLTPGAAAALSRDSRVLYVEEDGIAQVNDTQPSPPSWGLDRIDQRLLPLDGSFTYPAATYPVYVHVIDTGVRWTHIEFGGRAFNAGDFVDDDNNPSTDPSNDDGDPSTPDGMDCHGHGTHVAGTIAGSNYGIAKTATILGYRTLDCSGSGAYSGIIAALDTVAADARRPAVVNMSLGGPASFTLDSAVNRVINAGITVVVAAGNSNDNASNYSPSRVPNAITVGATDSNDVRASFSNFGAVLDLFAPGVSINSSWGSSNTAYATLSGTSMASPHVAGVAALYLSTVGDKTPAQVHDTLVANATAGLVGSAGSGSPNLLLYEGFLNTSSTTRTNVAAAANGGVATASSTYSNGYAASGAINGDRTGTNWGMGGGWNEAEPNSYPDWLQVQFNGVKTIDEVDVFSVQDNYQSPVTPTAQMMFSRFGLRDFRVEYWTGTIWQTIPGATATGNSLVWKQFTFTPITTSAIRVVVSAAADGWSRLVEVEAYSSGSSTVNVPPTVSITSPSDGATAVALASFTFSANANDSDGTVSQVTFYVNGSPLFTDTIAPYTTPWSNVAAGTYTLTAVAQDNSGATTTASTVVVTVTNPSSNRINVAAAVNGGVATASSTYSSSYAASGVINGDRAGVNWGAGGGWNEADPNTFPDWLQVQFNSAKTIDEVDVFSVQDNYQSPTTPTTGMTFTRFGLRDFRVEYWTGTAWQTIPGATVSGNSLVWRQLTFTPVTTSAIRVVVTATPDGWSRAVELEAYGN